MVYTFVHDPPYLRKLKGKGRADYLGIVCLVLSLGLGEIVMDRGDRADWFQTRVGLLFLGDRAQRLRRVDRPRVAHPQSDTPGEADHQSLLRRSDHVAHHSDVHARMGCRF